LRRHCLIKHIIEKKKKHKREKRREGKEDDVSSYWLILSKQKDTGNGNRKHYIALCGKLASEEAVYLS
jgi:hypothetical protein